MAKDPIDYSDERNYLPHAAQAVAGQLAGALPGLLNALGKPIWSNQETTVVTHQAENGDVITRTRVKGWTIPLGLPVLVVGSIALWEVGNFLAQGIAKVENAVTGVVDILNPSTWPQFAIQIPSQVQQDLHNIAPWAFKAPQQVTPSTPANPATSVVYSRSPSAMASLSNLVQNVVDPVASVIGAYGPNFVQKLMPPP